MAAIWSQSMSTGVPEVDNQHKELFRQLDSLHAAMSQGCGRNEIEKTLDFLGDYVVKHFAEEEELMADVACPAAAENKRAHREFLTLFNTFRKRFDEAGASISLVMEINETVSHWLVQHIGKIDMQLKDCMAKA